MPKTQTTPVYNCPDKTKCPMNGNCFQPCIIYQATTKTKDNQENFTLA